FYIHIHKRHRCGCYTWDAAGMSKRSWPDFGQLFLHFARESTHRAIVEPFRDAALLGLLQPIYGALLLLQVTFVFDFSFDRLQFIPDIRRQIGVDERSLLRQALWRQLVDHWHKIFDDDPRPLKKLRKRLPNGRSLSFGRLQFIPRGTPWSGPEPCPNIRSDASLFEQSLEGIKSFLLAFEFLPGLIRNQPHPSTMRG